MQTLHNEVRKRIHSSDEESVAPLLDRLLLKLQKIQDNISNNHLSNTEKIIKHFKKSIEIHCFVVVICEDWYVGQVMTIDVEMTCINFMNYSKNHERYAI